MTQLDECIMYVALGKKKLQILESFKLYQAKTEIKFEKILKQGVKTRYNESFTTDNFISVR